MEEKGLARNFNVVDAKKKVTGTRKSSLRWRRLFLAALRATGALVLPGDEFGGLGKGFRINFTNGLRGATCLHANRNWRHYEKRWGQPDSADLAQTFRAGHGSCNLSRSCAIFAL